jgi:1,4-dihydroxy-2-naphthoate octaprenyltransferase
VNKGKFKAKHWLAAWLISARLFAVPWVLLYTLFGALLASVRDWVSAVGTIPVVVCILLASHFRNNYRDVELGVDKYVENIEEAKKVISTIKPYTAAAWLVPLRITPVWFQKVNERLFIALSVVIYVFLVKPWLNPYTIPIYLLGVALGLSYTDFFKRKGIGEVAAFIGHGWATTIFGYISQSQNFTTAILAGIAPGLLSAFAYSIDQYVDLKTDFVRRVRSIAEAWFNSKLPLGVYIIAIYFSFIHLVTLMVAVGIYPKGILLVYAVTPIILLVSARIEYNRDKAIRDGVVILVILIPMLMCLGTLL